MPDTDVFGRRFPSRPQFEGAVNASEACPWNGRRRDDARFDRLPEGPRRIRSQLVGGQEQAFVGAGLQQCSRGPDVAFGSLTTPPGAVPRAMRAQCRELRPAVRPRPSPAAIPTSRQLIRRRAPAATYGAAGGGAMRLCNLRAPMPQTGPYSSVYNQNPGAVPVATAQATYPSTTYPATGAPTNADPYAAGAAAATNTYPGARPEFAPLMPAPPIPPGYNAPAAAAPVTGGGYQYPDPARAVDQPVPLPMPLLERGQQALWCRCLRSTRSERSARGCCRRILRSGQCLPIDRRRLSDHRQ